MGRTFMAKCDYKTGTEGVYKNRNDVFFSFERINRAN